MLFLLFSSKEEKLSTFKKNNQNMDYGKEFRKYATKHVGINSTVYDDVMSHAYGAKNMTRTVIEERPMPFREVDVFSRLMADRIIFLGTGIDDYIANIIQAQLLFLE